MSETVSETLSTAALMARFIVKAGVGHVFGYPGDPNLDFIEHARREGVEFVLTRREGTAAFMADAYGQLTGLPGVCLSTLGPGSTNLVNGVAGAYLDRSPMLAISGQMNTWLEPVFGHQNIDHNRLFAPITKWTTRMVPAAAAAIMRKAFRVAVAERPGPVHITTPADVVAAEATDCDLTLPPLAAKAAWTQAFGGGPAPAARLAKARRPVVLAGASALRAGAGPALTAFAERVGCPVVVSPKAKGVVAEDHAYFAGTLDMACSALVWDFLASSDLLLAVGFDGVELLKEWRLAVPVIHIDSVPNTDQIYPAEVELVGPPAAILGDLADSYAGEAKWREAEVRAHREALFRLYYEGRVSGALNPTDVVDAVKDAFPRNTIVTSDVGSHKLLIGQGWRAYEPGAVLMTNGLSAMGFSLPAAMTAKMLRRDRPVVCFTGDGGFAMVEGELRLAASLGLGLVVVVFCDDSLNRIELKQIIRQYPSVGTRFDPTDLVKLAQSMDCDGERVETRAALDSALAHAAALDRPLVIEARIDPAQYMAQF